MYSLSRMNQDIRDNYSDRDSQTFCSCGLEIPVLSMKMLIKYDCSETLPCLREAEVEEER